MNYTFVNPQLLNEINQKTKKLVQYWEYPEDRAWQVWKMVATIESGLADKTFYHNDGIIVDGWNGYRNYTDGSNPDPYRAWGGFYRYEKAQMVGWTLYLTWQHEDPMTKGEELRRVADTYHLYNLIWEDVPMIWGFRGFQDFYTEKEAQTSLENENNRRGYKRGEITYSDVSGCYRVTVENSVAKPKLRDVYKLRIEP